MDVGTNAERFSPVSGNPNADTSDAQAMDVLIVEGRHRLRVKQQRHRAADRVTFHQLTRFQFVEHSQRGFHDRSMRLALRTNKNTHTASTATPITASSPVLAGGAAGLTTGFG